MTIAEIQSVMNVSLIVNSDKICYDFLRRE